MAVSSAHMIDTLMQFSTIVQTVAIGVGLCLVVSGFYKLKKYGESRTFMSQQLSIWGPLVKIIAGVLLMAFPTVLATVVNMLWSTSSPVKYVDSGNPWDGVIRVILTLVRLIGVVAIFRSVMLFSKSGSSNGQTGLIGKGMVHLLGGLFCIHIYGAYQALKSWIGI